MRLLTQGSQKFSTATWQRHRGVFLYAVFFVLISLTLLSFPCHAQDDIQNNTTIEISATVMEGIDCPYDPACEVLPAGYTPYAPQQPHIFNTPEQKTETPAPQQTTTNIAALTPPPSQR